MEKVRALTRLSSETQDCYDTRESKGAKFGSPKAFLSGRRVNPYEEEVREESGRFSSGMQETSPPLETGDIQTLT